MSEIRGALEGVCRKKKLFTAKGRTELEGLKLGPGPSASSLLSCLLHIRRGALSGGRARGGRRGGRRPGDVLEIEEVQQVGLGGVAVG